MWMFRFLILRMYRPRRVRLWLEVRRWGTRQSRTYTHGPIGIFLAMAGQGRPRYRRRACTKTAPAPVISLVANAEGGSAVDRAEYVGRDQGIEPRGSRRLAHLAAIGLQRQWVDHADAAARWCKCDGEWQEAGVRLLHQPFAGEYSDASGCDLGGRLQVRLTYGGQTSAVFMASRRKRWRRRSLPCSAEGLTWRRRTPMARTSGRRRYIQGRPRPRNRARRSAQLYGNGFGATNSAVQSGSTMQIGGVDTGAGGDDRRDGGEGAIPGGIGGTGRVSVQRGGAD